MQIDVETLKKEYRVAKKRVKEVAAQIGELETQKEKAQNAYGGCASLLMAILGREEGLKVINEIDASINEEISATNNDVEFPPHKVTDAIWKAVENSGSKGSTVDDVKETIQGWGFKTEGNTIYSTLHRFANGGSKGRELRKVGDRYYT